MNLLKIAAFCGLFGGSLLAQELYDLVSEYRKNGLVNVKAALEKQLLTREYWDSVVANRDVRLGYFESVKYVFVASKEGENLALFEVKGENLVQLKSTAAIFGDNKGDKRIEGDLATPIGVYDLTQRLSNPDQYYGPLAFVTSYPNLLDRLGKKTGGGIWIHGLPLNGDRSDKNTRGCIALENPTLLQVDKAINHKEAVLITTNQRLPEVQKGAIAGILQALFVWRDAWINNDLELYLSFYSDRFVRFDGMKIDEFRDYKKRVFAKEEAKSIAFSNINIVPYPNDGELGADESGGNAAAKNGVAGAATVATTAAGAAKSGGALGRESFPSNAALFRVTFLEDYKADSGYKFKGVKELYVLVNGGKVSIVVEK